MKKFLFLLSVATLISSAAYAKHDCDCSHCGDDSYKMMSRGGFNDVAAQPMSVANVLKQSEDAYVTMHGVITKRLSDDKYNFSDGTGNIILEIKDKIWHGQIVSPKDKVAVFGVVEESGGQTIVDVKSLKLAN